MEMDQYLFKIIAVLAWIKGGTTGMATGHRNTIVRNRVCGQCGIKGEMHAVILKEGFGVLERRRFKFGFDKAAPSKCFPVIFSERNDFNLGDFTKEITLAYKILDNFGLP